MNIPLINVSFQNSIPASPSPVSSSQQVVDRESLVSTISPVLETESTAALANSANGSLANPLPQSLSNTPAISTDPVPSSSPQSGSDTAASGASEFADGTEAVANPEADNVSGSNVTTSGQQASDANGSANPQVNQDQGNNGVENPSSDNTGDITLSPEEMSQIEALAARDREVRVHERAHQAAGGQFTGAASFSFQRGPDGIQYAVGGEVPIDVSPIPGDPQATIEKMQTVRRAANAPADPSAADRSVAAAATRIMLQAQSELLTEKQQQRQDQADKGSEQRATNDRNRSDAIQTYTELNGIGVEGENARDIAKLLPELDLSI